MFTKLEPRTVRVERYVTFEILVLVNPSKTGFLPNKYTRTQKTRLRCLEK
jgi:hypothetical protein